MVGVLAQKYVKVKKAKLAKAAKQTKLKEKENPQILFLERDLQLLRKNTPFFFKNVHFFS